MSQREISFTLKRIAKNSEYTIGRLFIEGSYFCDTLEDSIKKIKIPGKTAIPKGRYRVIMSDSFKYNKRMPELLDVPNFSGIRIHAGNTAEDTQGCILVGKNTIKGKLTNSRATRDALYGRIELYLASGNIIYITIE
jgi:hypothetical protein